jgi:hypothetical protein
MQLPSSANGTAGFCSQEAEVLGSTSEIYLLSDTWADRIYIVMKFS